MPFSSGTYSLPSGNPVVTGTTISSSTTNTTNSDIATALSTCVLKDGTQTITANLPMASHKLTGLSAGTTAGDSVEYGGSPSFTNLAYTGTLTGSTGVLNIGSGQVYKDASGNVGIGTTSPGAILHISKTAAAAPTVGAFLSNNDNTVGTEVRLGFAANTNLLSQDRYGWIGYLNTGGSNGGALTFATTPGGTPATERMRIDSSGNVGIGTSSPSKKLDILGEAQISFNSINTYLYYQSTNNYTGRDTDGNMWMNVAGGQNNIFGVAGSEKMRIDSSGNLLVGTTSALVTPSRIAVVYPGDTTWGIGFKSSYLTGNGQPCTFINSSNAVIGYIGTNGTGTSYITSSDYRLKENVVPITNSLARVMNLKPSRFNFISEADRTVDGFLAHEAQEVVPECVIGTKDALNEDGTPNYQGIDQAKLVPLLTAAIQEQQTLIEALTARLTALEAK